MMTIKVAKRKYKECSPITSLVENVDPFTLNWIMSRNGKHRDRTVYHNRNYLGALRTQDAYIHGRLTMLVPGIGIRERFGPNGWRNCNPRNLMSRG